MALADRGAFFIHGFYFAYAEFYERERRPVEQLSLLASKKFQTAIFSIFGVAVLIILGIFAWNRALARQVGRRTEELEKELTERKRMEGELRHAHEKLEKRVEERTTDLRNANDLLEHKFTERKRMEEELLLSHFCINKAAIGIFQVSLDDGKILRVNDSACLSLGYSSDELCAMSVFAIDPSLTWERFVYLVRESGLSGSLTFETIRRRKDGTTFPVEVTIHNREFHGKSTGFTFFRDITEQKRAIAELELTQFYVNKASIAIHRVSEEGNILFVNDATCEGLGYTADELHSMTVFDIDPAFNLEKFQEHRRIARAAGSRTFESIHRRKDGSTFPVEITVNYLKYQDKEFSVSFAKDITERKEAEEALRESRAKYQTIVDAFDGLIYVCSQDYRIEFMNRKLIERTGRDATGEYCYKVLHGRDSVCPWCVNDRVFAGETIHWDVVSPKDKRWYEVLNVPIRHADGSMSKHSVMVDINDRKLFEKELQRQKKLLEELNETLEKRVEAEVAKNREKDFMLMLQNRQAALGEMLDHIAHQWKQPLNSISLIVQMLGETISMGGLTEDAVEDAVGKTVSLVQHMAQTIETFRGFYRPDKVKTLFNIKETVDQALAFIAPDFRFHSIEVELDVDPGLTAFGYPKEYAQVLLNILANARNVFRARGTEKPKVMIRAFAEDNKTVVIIADNAGGIPQAIMDKIFDFYFTTNESCCGTGIGLYMSKNIIEKNMGGTLSAANTEGGAQFVIEISPT